MEKNHNFLTNLRHGQKYFDLLGSKAKNLPKKIMGVYFIVKLEFWL